MMNITKALAALDPGNDDHWTADGAPRVDAVAALTGNAEVSRQEITDAAPQLTRESAPDHTKENEDGGAHNEGGGEGEGRQEKAQAEEVSEPPPSVAVGDQPSEQGDEEASPEVADEDSIEARVPSIVFGLPEDQPAIAEIQMKLDTATDIMITAQKAARDAKKVADQSANEVNGLNRLMDRYMKKDPNHGTANIRAYLVQQNRNRLERADRVAAFTNLGLDMKTLAKAVGPAAIDAAMKTRKAARGAVRQVRPPMNKAQAAPASAA